MKLPLFVCIDIQERLLPVMHEPQALIRRSNILLESARALNAPLLITEQYTRGLGKSVESLCIPPQAVVMEKISFGIFGDKDITAHIDSLKEDTCKTLIFWGIETHICVLQSAIQAKQRGYTCYLAADACSSRKAQDKELALDFMRTQGIHVLPLESILFLLLENCKHEQFKTIAALIK